jgi:hypothetical protein
MLVLWAEGAIYCSHMQDHFGEPAYSNQLTLAAFPPKEGLGLRHPE